MKHLVVDDTYINRFVIKKFLERGGYKVDDANNGRDAIDLAKKSDYEIIWIDLEMPIMDGITCTQKLRNDMNYQGKIVGITGHVDDKSLKLCKINGMDEVLAKPIRPQTLLNVAKKYIH